MKISHCRLILLIFPLFTHTITMVMGVGPQIESLLLNHLFSNYSPSVRPVTHPQHTIHLMFNLRLWQLISVGEYADSFNVQTLT